MPAISPARAANVAATHAWTKLYDEIMSWISGAVHAMTGSTWSNLNHCPYLYRLWAPCHWWSVEAQTRSYHMCFNFAPGCQCCTQAIARLHAQELDLREIFECTYLKFTVYNCLKTCFGAYHPLLWMTKCYDKVSKTCFCSDHPLLGKKTAFVTKYVMTSFKKHILHTTYIIVLKEHNFGSISERVLIQSSKHVLTWASITATECTPLSS